MQAFILPDYLLGNTFSEKNKNTFIGEAPSYIWSLNDIEFVIDSMGNYKFKESNEIYKPFIELSYNNPSVGNFFIVFQRYMKNPLNLIQENRVPSTELSINESFVGYIKPKELRDSDNELVRDVFISISQETKEIIIIYFYQNNKIGYSRNNLVNIRFGVGLVEHDKQVLSIVNEYLNNKSNYVSVKDKLKTKYLSRFTQLEYTKI